MQLTSCGVWGERNNKENIPSIPSKMTQQVVEMVVKVVVEELELLSIPPLGKGHEIRRRASGQYFYDACTGVTFLIRNNDEVGG